MGVATASTTAGVVEMDVDSAEATTAGTAAAGVATAAMAATEAAAGEGGPRVMTWALLALALCVAADIISVRAPLTEVGSSGAAAERCSATPRA